MKRMCKYYSIQVLFFVKFYFYVLAISTSQFTAPTYCHSKLSVRDLLLYPTAALNPRLQIKFAVDVVVKGEKSVAASKRGNAKRQGLDYRPVSTRINLIKG